MLRNTSPPFWQVSDSSEMKMLDKWHMREGAMAFINPVIAPIHLGLPSH